jgi:hypothetical protein
MPSPFDNVNQLRAKTQRIAESNTAATKNQFDMLAAQILAKGKTDLATQNATAKTNLMYQKEGVSGEGDPIAKLRQIAQSKLANTQAQTQRWNTESGVVPPNKGKTGTVFNPTLGLPNPMGMPTARRVAVPSPQATAVAGRVTKTDETIRKYFVWIGDQYVQVTKKEAIQRKGQGEPIKVVGVDDPPPTQPPTTTPTAPKPLTAQPASSSQGTFNPDQRVKLQGLMGSMNVRGTPTDTYNINPNTGEMHITVIDEKGVPVTVVLSREQVKAIQ